MNVCKVNYNIVEFLVETTLAKLRGKGVKADYIVGIGRGGLIPATLMGYSLGLPVLNFGVSSYKGKQRTDKLDIYQDIDFTKLKADSRLLVVDDICDTGNTFAAFRALYKGNIKQCVYVSLFAKESSELYVDFCGATVNEDTWVEFPWDK
jgi:hypoxanthine phosphoribosyltransferase